MDAAFGVVAVQHKAHRPLESIAKTMSTPLNKYCWNCKSHLIRLFQTWQWLENLVTSTNLATERAAVALLENQKRSRIQHFQKAIKHQAFSRRRKVSICLFVICCSKFKWSLTQNATKPVVSVQLKLWKTIGFWTSANNLQTYYVSASTARPQGPWTLWHRRSGRKQSGRSGVVLYIPLG